RGDEPRAALDEPDGAGDGGEAVRTGLAEHDVVRVGLGEDVTGLVQRGGQPRLADDEGRTAGTLVLEELRRRQRRGPDRRLRHVQTTVQQAGTQIAWRVDRVVRQHEEPRAGRTELGQELVR